MGSIQEAKTELFLASDAFSQYANFHASFNNVLKGEQSIFYTWYGSLGLNYWAFISYYLGGVFTPLVFFFDNVNMPDYLYFLTLLKIGSVGLSFWILSIQTFKIPKWTQVLLSISYALMSFVISFSEIVMWLDGLIFLPLIALGIHRLLEQRKPTLLFISYLVLFLSNFYIAFIVGLFSFCYFIAKMCAEPQKYRKRLPMYLLTSVLAGGASMLLILPTILDLRNNGEALSAIRHLKTAATGPLDLVIKNMVGVYDSTKFGSIPYLFAGLFGLIFCLYYFVSKKNSLREKICFGSLFLLLIFSFYLEPLNLLWQGMHAPNMFLFRYSFLFSFLVLLLAGYGIEKYEDSDFEQLTTIIVTLLVLFIGTKILMDRSTNEYLTNFSFILTILFLVGYLFVFFLLSKTKKYKTFVILLLFLTTSFELTLNSLEIIKGISVEWNYPARKFYSGSYSDIKDLVDETKAENETFYRLENLDAISANDSFNYGYSGISMFSSIRNRHSSVYLNDLGYRSLGTNLNIRYGNNTLLMDSLIGVKYNLSKTELNKFGFDEKDRRGEYKLYENKSALPLGILTDKEIYEPDAVQTQATLFNHLAETNEDFFTFASTKKIRTKNLKEEVKKINKTTIVTYTAENKAEPIEIEWESIVPAGKQAYFSVHPTNYEDLGATKLAIKVNEEERISTISETGQYYDLGYYDALTTIQFKTTFYGGEGNNIGIIAPDIALMDVDKFKKAFKSVEEKGVELSVTGRKVTGQVTVEKDQVLLTTIPYDRGWKAYVDGKKVEIPIFKQALLTMPIPTGEHEITLVFLPEGIVVGSCLFILCIVIFSGYRYWLKKPLNKV